MTSAPVAAAAQQKKTLQSMLASKLHNLTIPQSSSTDNEFDFADVFGPNSSSSSTNPNPNPNLFIGDPQIIHNRSHSFIGPSPRYTCSKSLPFQHEFDPESSGEEDDLVEVEKVVEVEIEKKGKLDFCKIGPGDFEIMRVIGKGSFGKVFQVRRKGRNVINGDGEGVIGDGIYAMKVMRKDTIIKNNHVDYMKAERDILTKVIHPFVVQLRYSFQTKTKLYLILDFINGGHLFFHLYRQGIFSEDQARVYTAEIVSAVSHLHQSGIVHRDLKPENILMDADGHVMLTDFGLAKEIDESSRSNSMCGTTEYMAPEILLAKGHNKSADWWSVGILLYEMLTGKPPYIHSNRKKLQEKIINEKIKLLPRLSGEAHSLLKGLLTKDPSTRLGSGPRGSDDIKGHKWFRTINWRKLESRELQPKFKPDVSGEDCTENFDKCWTAMPLDDSPAPTPTGGEHFHGYTYVAPNPWLSSPE
ncbi:serine/threonine-protein kinase AtPK1/AtPK6-like [Rutidosis leptorrhynchoides]|uniref:serine/threonine-protein kinase AtPK1/AtPK6-like n=1 Tax=Rutidosis leptorrhynchoides TaxID=125765 RepID=UPI003A993B2A